jgi:hypothetical protein
VGSAFGVGNVPRMFRYQGAFEGLREGLESLAVPYVNRSSIESANVGDRKIVN